MICEFLKEKGNAADARATVPERESYTPREPPRQARQWAALSDVIKITQLADWHLDDKGGL
ncbi:hypothetical protein GV819_32530 [Pseudomonas sp. Fl5BN2]|nr:hypothetical protein [Pseudomonas sp. Fl5BN2]